MKFHFAAAALAALLWQAPLAVAAEVSVTVAPPKNPVARGATPRFVVTVRANERVRMIDLAHRPDVRERLAQPRIGPGPRGDDIPIVMSDLGPVGDADYVVLERGQTMRFTHDGAPRQLSALEPGRYTMAVRLRTDFDRPFVDSNRAAFTVAPSPAGR